MKGLLTLVSLPCIALSTLSVCPQGHAGEWQFAPSSRLTSGYTSNPRFLPDGGDDEVQNSAELGAQLSGGTERFKLAVKPHAAFSRFRSDQSLDTNDQYLGLNTSWAGERVSWGGNAQIARDSTQSSELGTTGLVQTNIRRESATVGGGPRWTVSENLTTGATVQWNDVHYADAPSSGLVDYSRSSASLFGTLVTSDRTRFTLTTQGVKLATSNRAQATRDAGITLGFSHELDPQWSVSVTAGPSWADSGVDTLQGTLYSADVIRQGELLQITAGAYRRLDPIGTGYLSLAEALNVSATQQLSERLSATLAAQVSRTRALFDGTDDGSETRYGTAIASLSWNIVRAWTLLFSFEQRYQDVSSSAAFPGTADSRRVWLGIGWNGRAQLL